MDIKRILLIGGLGLVAVVGFLQLQKMGKPVAPRQAVATPVVKAVSTVKYVDILVASRDISLGTRLNPEMMAWKKWPKKGLMENFIDNQTQPNALEIFTRSVTQTAIYEGEPIMARKVVQTGEQGQMSSLLSAGMRAIATRINVETAAGGFIKPGDRVDVVLTTRAMGTSNGQANYNARTIFENVGVRAIGKTYANTADGTAYVSGSTATLELSQSDAEMLIEAQSKGDISLTLRPLDRRKAGFVPSASVAGRRKSGEVTSVTIYRNGQPQQVSLQGP